MLSKISHSASTCKSPEIPSSVPPLGLARRLSWTWVFHDGISRHATGAERRLGRSRRAKFESGEWPLGVLIDRSNLPGPPAPESRTFPERDENEQRQIAPADVATRPSENSKAMDDGKFSGCSEAARKKGLPRTTKPSTQRRGYFLIETRRDEGSRVVLISKSIQCRDRPTNVPGGITGWFGKRLGPTYPGRGLDVPTVL